LLSADNLALQATGLLWCTYILQTNHTEGWRRLRKRHQSDSFIQNTGAPVPQSAAVPGGYGLSV